MIVAAVQLLFFHSWLILSSSRERLVIKKLILENQWLFCWLDIIIEVAFLSTIVLFIQLAPVTSEGSKVIIPLALILYSFLEDFSNREMLKLKSGC